MTAAVRHINPSVEATHRIRILLKSREESDAEIASLLREQLDGMGEGKWLAWCELEFGWSRTTAYRHLNPKLQERAKQSQAERRANVPTLEHKAERVRVVEDPANYRTSFLLRAEQAIRFANHSGPVTEEIVATARSVAEAWSSLADKLEKSL